MAKETVEITTMIGSLCTCASLRVRESVVAFFVNLVDFTTFCYENRLVFVSVRRTQSTHKTVIEGLSHRKKVHLALRV